MNRRLFLGLAAAIASQACIGYLLSFSPLIIIWQMAISSFLGAVIGSFVANRNFIIPATTLWFISWLLMFIILFNASNGQATAYSLIEFNKTAMVVSLLATILGCIVFQIRKPKNQAAII